MDLNAGAASRYCGEVGGQVGCRCSPTGWDAQPVATTIGGTAAVAKRARKGDEAAPRAVVLKASERDD